MVTSSPTMTSARRPRSRAIACAATRRVDPLVVGDRDDVELGQALDVVEDRRDAGRAIAGEGVDVEVRAAEPRRASVMPRPPAPGAAGPRRGLGSVTRPRLRPAAPSAPAVASASRSGQIGKKTAHHWSGASAMRSSNAAARRVIVVVTRSRRVPSVGDLDRDDLAAVSALPARRTVIA